MALCLDPMMPFWALLGTWKAEESILDFVGQTVEKRQIKMFGRKGLDGEALLLSTVGASPEELLVVRFDPATKTFAAQMFLSADPHPIQWTGTWGALDAASTFGLRLRWSVVGGSIKIETQTQLADDWMTITRRILKRP